MHSVSILREQHEESSDFSKSDIKNILLLLKMMYFNSIKINVTFEYACKICIKNVGR